MGIGEGVLLATGVATQGFGQLDLLQWLIIGRLAIVNTAFAFTLWNYTLRTLTAVESSIIHGAMLPQIAHPGLALSGRTAEPTSDPRPAAGRRRHADRAVVAPVATGILAIR